MKASVLPALAAIAFLAGCASTSRIAEDQVDITRFRGVNVAPVRFTTNVAQGRSDDELASLGLEFREALMQGLSTTLVAGDPKPGVVRVEVTITELNASSPAVNVLTTVLLFVPLDPGGVAFEARFFDGEAVEPFATTQYMHTSTPLELKGSFRRYGHATRALRKWATSLDAPMPTGRQGAGSWQTTSMLWPSGSNTKAP